MEEKLRQVSIAVEKLAPGVDQLFSYAYPPEMEGEITVGKRVLVPFGRGNNFRQGIILSIDEEAAKGPLKAVARVIDKEAVASKELIELIFWLREQCFCTYFDALKVMLPSGMFYKQKLKYMATDPSLGQSLEMSEKEKELLEIISVAKNGIGEENLIKKLGVKILPKEAESLMKKGLIAEMEILQRKVLDQTQLMVIKSEKEPAPGLKLSKKQGEVLNIMEEFLELSMGELLYYSGVSRSVVDALYKKGFVTYFDEEVYRNPLEDYPLNQEKTKIKLNNEQEQAFLGLRELLSAEKGETALLYGVTGSGKTQVFLRLIDEVIERGEQVIMMVPEIALTPQTIRIFRERFGETLAIMHSGLSLGERLDEYRRIKAGEAKIAVGTRSAVFAPFENIGLIIMDEEQEYSYKSDAAPRFHARNVARFRAGYHSALLLLASATPAIETYFNAERGFYHKFELKFRYGEAETPDTFIIDMNDEEKGADKSALSTHLKEGMAAALSKGEQCILLLNRRGFQTISVCRNCGEAAGCPNCSIALTYHKANGRYICHCCGWSVGELKKCAHCEGDSFDQFGLGTQRAQEQIVESFPQARVLRMDADTTMSKNAHERELGKFLAGEYDIMIGTQMVAKGLDFPNVTVVGVILADQSLYADDFRSYEKSFSLFMQVCGRSGRGKKPGEAYIQTYTPFNDIIRLAGEGDYEGFYKSEMAVRKLMLYPPFASFAVIGFSGLRDELVKKSAGGFMDILKKNIENSGKKIPVRIFGPSPGVRSRLAGKYRYKIVVKCVNSLDTRAIFRASLNEFQKTGFSRGASIFIDMNYYGGL